MVSHNHKDLSKLDLQFKAFKNEIERIQEEFKKKYPFSCILFMYLNLRNKREIVKSKARASA